MADVSNVVVEGQTYAFNDSNAEAKIATLNSGKVNKSGDTMTGALDVKNNSRIGLFDSDIKVGTPPSSAHYGAGVRLYDADSTLFGSVQPAYFSNGRVGLQFSARQAAGAATVQNNLFILVGSDGKPYIQVSNADAWRSGIDVPSNAEVAYKAGETVTLSGAQQYAGVWSNTTTLRFLIPLAKKVVGLSCMVSGGFIVRGAGKQSGDQLIDSSVTVSTNCKPEGVQVQIVFSAAPAYASANYAAGVQPNGMVLTFS